MAKRDRAPTTADKGKSKAVDDKALDVRNKPNDTKKDKDGKPIVNGKKGDEPQDGMEYIQTPNLRSRT